MVMRIFNRYIVPIIVFFGVHILFCILVFNDIRIVQTVVTTVFWGVFWGFYTTWIERGRDKDKNNKRKE